LSKQTYYLIVVNDVIKDYQLQYNNAVILANSYKKLAFETNASHYPIKIIEVKTVQEFNFL
jgi:hypothetical protein